MSDLGPITQVVSTPEVSRYSLSDDPGVMMPREGRAMTNRLATMWLAAIFLIGFTSASLRAQDADSLKGITAVGVAFEPLSDTAKRLGLTDESLQTDAELKLRLAGMRVVTLRESDNLPGSPCVYARVSLSSDAKAALVEVHLRQNVLLQRNSQFAGFVPTWVRSYIASDPTAQGIRDHLKDLIDEFLNDWLSVNPKK